MNEQVNKELDPTSIENRSFRKHRVWTGLFIIGIGVLWLMRQSGVQFPVWFFTWPVLLIAIGLLGAIKNSFRPGGWIAILLVGGIFLVDQVNPNSSFQVYAWPLLLVAVGLWIIVKPKSHHPHVGRWRRRRMEERRNYFNNAPSTIQGTDSITSYNDSNEFLDSTSVFGGIKKIILSKTFKGGEIINFMGGSEINLIQADIQGKIVIDTTNIFGGTKLIIPATWDVQSDVVAVFGGVDDKRQITSEPLQPNKIIQLKGVCIFGGIEIKSF